VPGANAIDDDFDRSVQNSVITTTNRLRIISARYAQPSP
jgi:hypothetical protein